MSFDPLNVDNDKYQYSPCFECSKEQYSKCYATGEACEKFGVRKK